MSKKPDSKTGNGWRYTCTCGYETLQIGSAVAHINTHRDHHLQRTEI